jgi:hypothetical protein
MIELGRTARDKITGFTGIVTARMEDLFSAPQVKIQSKDIQNGVPVVAQWFEEGRVKVSIDPPIVGFRGP